MCGRWRGGSQGVGTAYSSSSLPGGLASSSYTRGSPSRTSCVPRPRSAPLAWRYDRLLTHAVLGEGDVRGSALALVPVSVPVLAVGFMAVATRAGRQVAVPTAALVAAALLVVNSPEVRLLLAAGVSEAVTW